jgi:hypothetical protein
VLALMPLAQFYEWPSRPLITVHYLARTLGGGIVVAIVAVAWLRISDFRFRPRVLDAFEIPQVRRQCLLLAVAIQVAILPATIYAGFEWRKMLGELRATLQGNQGMIAVRDLPLSVARFFWDESDREFLIFLRRCVQGNINHALVEAAPEATQKHVNLSPAFLWRD